MGNGRNLYTMKTSKLFMLFLPVCILGEECQGYAEDFYYPARNTGHPFFKKGEVDSWHCYFPFCVEGVASRRDDGVVDGGGRFCGRSGLGRRSLMCGFRSSTRMTRSFTGLRG